ncbi:Rhodanese domain protein [Rippkaea orientalis PCC 8801]|uniref:Sulfurtransferase n=1 Tax=Rippkaea orientalis (strain PCC 8801 / RF-1) TaxID=41431 RepID=B7JV69_RIPO1|nr:sulfurtransferase [Rippkaea orientalis]ACK68202.1 Rhodanese domain protein [Rippkaea orientalis PCC 8801]
MKIPLFKQLSERKYWQSKALFFVSAIVIALIIPLLSIYPSTANTASKVQFVPPSWVAQVKSDSDIRILDVRTNPLDYIAGHIPNAVHIADPTFRGPNGLLPVQYWQNDKLQSLFTEAGVTDKTKVLVYADGREVLGATMVAYLLERTGHPNVTVLDGGFAGYKAAQLPVAKEFPKYKPGKFTIKDDPSVRVTLEQVKQAIGKPGVVFIDPRPPELFSGEQQIWVRNGHIPGAKNIPWGTFTVGESNFHQLKPLDEIKQLLAQRGITPDQDIIVTCSTGREATLQYHVLKHLLGYPKVRVYEGSWTEYSSYPDLPIETGKGS